MQLQIHVASLFNVCQFAAHEHIPIRISWHPNYIYPSFPDAFRSRALSDCPLCVVWVCVFYLIFPETCLYQKIVQKMSANVNLIQEILGKIHFHISGLLLHLTVT